MGNSKRKDESQINYNPTEISNNNKLTNISYDAALRAEQIEQQQNDVIFAIVTFD